MSSPMDAMNWPVIYPEMLLLAMACLITLVDLWVTDPLRRLTFWLTQITLGVVAFMHMNAFNAGTTPPRAHSPIMASGAIHKTA